MRRIGRGGVLAGLALAVCVSRSGGAEEGVRRIEPPERGFYSKRLDCRGIPIKAHAVVDDAALLAARARLARMLARLPDAAWNLAQEGAELHIIGRNQVTSDLPEQRHWKGKPYDGDQDIDRRTRGVGGLLASCGEENLLNLPGDRYAGRDICVHEFAHTLFQYGLSPEARARIVERYRRSLEKGRWRAAYAATKPDEYFAELTMWYFGTRGDRGKLDPAPQDGREGLRQYDPEAFRLLDDLYAGRIRIARLRRVRLPVLPPEREATLRSMEGGPATTVLFRNRTEQELTLCWLDAAGQRHAYGTLAPGETRGQETFAGHVWLVADGEGQAITLFIAATRPGLAEINHGK